MVLTKLNINLFNLKCFEELGKAGLIILEVFSSLNYSVVPLVLPNSCNYRVE